MNTVSKRCCRLSFAISKNSAIFLRPFCPALVKPEQFCSRNFDFQNVARDKFDDFEDSPNHELLENVDFDSIVGDDLEMKKKLEITILELSMKLQTETLLAPKKLNSNEWRNLLRCETDIHRKAYLKYLYVREKRKDLHEIIRRNKRDAIEQLNKREIDEPLTTSSPMDYSLQSTTLFNRIHPRFLMQKLNSNLALATIFGEDLIIDCSYEEFMSPSGMYSCGRQISYLYSCNRASNTPFNLILCNVDKNSKLMEVLTSTFPNLNQGNYFITITEKHYLDLYPAEKLVYMTPHCHDDMEKFEEDSVYILGAFVDVGKFNPVSSAKAKKHGIRTARLPLDKHLNWSQGSKLLPFNVCARILNDLKAGSCWQYALRHVDIRKQKFQFCDNDVDIRKEQKLAAIHVRQEATKNILFNFKSERLHKNNEIDCSPSDIDNNQNEFSPNDGF